MASPAEEALPALPPIKTAPLPPPPCASASASPSPAPASSSTGDSAKEAEEAEEPSTPTSEESRLRPPSVCPPAPRKPPPPRLPAPKRKPALLPSPARVFVTVPRDLSTVFRALPPKKRIRVSSRIEDIAVTEWKQFNEKKGEIRYDLGNYDNY
ncbi:hypothetical protein EJB05_43622, partial [Eragrostis curvula]